jgi:hypothetical protein
MVGFYANSMLVRFRCSPDCLMKALEAEFFIICRQKMRPQGAFGVANIK